jgi:hypothetical protein
MDSSLKVMYYRQILQRPSLSRHWGYINECPRLARHGSKSRKLSTRNSTIYTEYAGLLSLLHAKQLTLNTTNECVVAGSSRDIHNVDILSNAYPKHINPTSRWVFHKYKLNSHGLYCNGDMKIGKRFHPFSESPFAGYFELIWNCSL